MISSSTHAAIDGSIDTSTGRLHRRRLHVIEIWPRDDGLSHAGRRPAAAHLEVPQSPREGT